MSKFIKLDRFTIIVTLACDLDCKYCYRHSGKIPQVPKLSPLMLEYLRQLDPEKTQACVLSGGEPLLDWELCRTIFDTLPKGTHKKIMTNGINFTDEIVDYVNKNNVEIWVSHDGDMTEFLRGYDVLRDQEARSKIERINDLTFSCTCTSYNPDPWRCYQQIKKIFNGRDFDFHSTAVYAESTCPELVKDFDYQAYQAGRLQCEVHGLGLTGSNNKPLHYRAGIGSTNLLPNGDIVSQYNCTVKYGTITDSKSTIIQNRNKLGDRSTCDNVDCEYIQIKGLCGKNPRDRTTHSCNIKKIHSNIRKRIEIHNDEI